MKLHDRPTLAPTYRPALVALGACALAAAGEAQQRTAFSIHWHGPTIAAPDCASGTPITEGDVLAPCTGTPALGPLPTPRILITGGPGGLGLPAHPGCVGHAPGTPCGVEVDALSFGTSQPLSPDLPIRHRLVYSADEYAVGIAGMATPPTVWTEACGDLSADAFVDLGLGFGPLPPFAAFVPGSTGLLDGDGLPGCGGFQYPGLGLKEPNVPGFVLPDSGDDVDALSTYDGLDGTPTRAFFSLDGCFPDPLTGFPNSCSAATVGATGADVLTNVVPSVGPPSLYAPGPALGLNLLGNASDDLDALILAENAVPGFQPSHTPYDWAGGATDMLLFSVRRGSAVIGMPDSIFGLPISEGDVLTTPLPTAMGGVSPFPGIFVAAENLGLATVRSGLAANTGDELDALDLLREPMFDCNGNGVEDAVDIAIGSSSDLNRNGVPDECEGGVTTSCFCASGAPCGNVDSSAGCANSTGAGALLNQGAGSTSVAADDLVLEVTQLPINRPGILFMGPTSVAPVPFGDGLRCVGGPFYRFPVQSSGATGTFTFGPGLVGYTVANFPVPGHITVGSAWSFQSWYRNPGGPCGSNFNLSNMLTATFAP